MSEKIRIGQSAWKKHGVFDLEYTDGGYIRVFYKGIFLQEGRPWIKDPAHAEYSDLVACILEEKQNNPVCLIRNCSKKSTQDGFCEEHQKYPQFKCCKSGCNKERSELSNYCTDHQMWL